MGLMDDFEKKRRVAVCHGPHCSARGSAALLTLLNAEIEALGLGAEVGTRPGACNKLCEEGPSMVVHPDRIWYSRLTPERMQEIVRSHLANDAPVDRIVARDLGPAPEL